MSFVVFVIYLPIRRVNFMCQLGWITACPDIWLNITSVSLFLEHISIWITGLSRVDCLRICGWAISNVLKAWIETNKQKKMEEGRICWFSTWLLSGDISLPLYSALSFQGESTPPVPFFGLHAFDLYYLPGSPGCIWQVMGLLSLHNSISQYTPIL